MDAFYYAGKSGDHRKRLSDRLLCPPLPLRESDGPKINKIYLFINIKSDCLVIRYLLVGGDRT